MCFNIHGNHGVVSLNRIPKETGLQLVRVSTSVRNNSDVSKIQILHVRVQTRIGEDSLVLNPDWILCSSMIDETGCPVLVAVAKYQVHVTVRVKIEHLRLTPDLA